MGYKAIYAYPWDFAETGVGAAVDRFLARPRYGDNRRELPCRQVPPAARQGGRGHFPEDRTVIQARSQPLRRDQADRAFDALFGQDMVRERACRAARLATNVWLVLMHNARLGAAHIESTVARLRRPILLQSLPLCARSARLCDWSSRDVTDYYPVSGVSLETPAFCPTRTASTTNSRSTAGIAGSTVSLVFVSARTAWRAPNAPESPSKR